MTHTTDMAVPKYSVKQAAELTGLTLNQVRLWERRYHLVEPRRADNGYRLYSQQDLDILRYAKQETQKGVNIQIVSEQITTNRDQILQKMAESKKITPRKMKKIDPKRLPNYDLMMHSISNGDPMKFERLLIQAQAGKNFAEALRQVDLPILSHIGELAMHGEINIASSHLASAIIRRRILSHIQNLGVPRNGKPVLLACAPNDYHELGLLYCLLELTQQLIPTLYLGPNVPLKEIKYYANKVSPAAILISITAPLNEENATELFDELRSLSQDYPVGVGGFEAEKRHLELQKHELNLIKSVESLIDWPAIA